eukprot:9133391-Pyramimonas_sp.AAC.1
MVGIANAVFLGLGPRANPINDDQSLSKNLSRRGVQGGDVATHAQLEPYGASCSGARRRAFDPRAATFDFS